MMILTLLRTRMGQNELDSWGYEFPVFEDLDEDAEPEENFQSRMKMT